MVVRGISAEAAAQLEKYGLYQAMIIHIAFAGGDLRITDNFQNVSFGGNIYEAGGGYVDLGAIGESMELRNSSVQLKLDGLTGILPAILLGEDVIDRPVTITRVYLDANHQVDSNILLLVGSISGGGLDDSRGDIATLAISSHWANWDAINGRRTNSTSQQRHFPTDTAFRFAATSAKEIPWGRP